MDNVSSYRISTQTVAPSTGDLVDLTTVKSDWAIATSSDDTFLQRTISRCSASAQQYCNRTFGSATYQDTFRLEQGWRTGRFVNGGCSPLKLSVWPLISVTSVTLVASDGTTTALTEGVDFEKDAASGFLYRLGVTKQPRDWSPVETVIVFQAGYSTIPLDIQDAVSRMVWTRYAERRRDPMVSEETIFGVRSRKYLPGAGSDGNLSPDIADILENYRMPVTA